MSPAFMDALNWLVLSIFLSGMTFLVRSPVDFAIKYKFNNAKNIVIWTKFWEDVALPSIPFLLGMLFGVLFKKYPYPDEFHATSARVCYVSSAGLFSGLTFKVLKATLTMKIKNADPNADTKDLTDKKV